MAWKLPERYRKLADDRWWRQPFATTAWSDEVTEVGPLLRSKHARGRYRGYTDHGKRGLAQYCLVVEGNRNFFAEGLAVSNCIYDCPVLARHGMVVAGPIDDTMLMHHSAFPGLAHDLQRVTTQFYAITPWKAEYRAGQGAIDELCRYNARDSLATARIRAPLVNALAHSKGEDTYKVDMAMARAAERMHVVGVPISR
jgi:hypothetical protein